MGIGGSLDVNLSCWYCQDTGHKLDNCKQLQQKLACKHADTWRIVPGQLLNTKHHERRACLMVKRLGFTTFTGLRKKRHWATKKNRSKINANQV